MNTDLRLLAGGGYLSSRRALAMLASFTEGGELLVQM